MSWNPPKLSSSAVEQPCGRNEQCSGEFKMKLIKRIPFQIFILVLLAGFAGIGGMLIMQHHISEISKNYEQIIGRSLQDRLDMSELQNLIYRHQTIVSWHTFSDSKESKAAYKEEADGLESLIMETLDEINANVSGSEKEQLFHKVYSDAVGYFQNAENVFKLSGEGNTATAEYYIISSMSKFINSINANAAIMDEYIDGEMNATREKMESTITAAGISEIVCSMAIVIVMAVCLILCVRITSNLENYKNRLEIDNEKKTREIMERNRKMLAIQESTIIGMANLIESRDHDTGEHVKRTSVYVELLAKAAQKDGYLPEILNDRYVELTVKAAPLHDIGKITVSDSILQKPGKLTEEEFERMKTHTTAGGRIVGEVLGNIEDREYIEIASRVAAAHHEKWNGSGYPLGLKGDEIPLCARIMAVADVFDALVSKRCYKEQMPVDKAFDIIKESGGTHFDPELARLFVSIRSDIEKVLDE